jgi:hypothetical protein
MSNIIPYNEMEKMALATAKSGLFGLKSQDQALTLMMIAQSQGIHPMSAIMLYDIIDGKPAPKATTIQARFQEEGGKIEWLHTDSEKAIAKFTHPEGGEITITWTMEKAKRADLLKKQNWQKYPDQMLRARCIPEGVRAILPKCLHGMYSSDEVRDFTEPQPAPVVDTGEFIEAEVEEPKPVLKVEKSRLVRKLEELQLSTADIKAFAAHFNLGEDVDTIVALNNDESLLVEKVKEFEGAQQ